MATLGFKADIAARLPCSWSAVWPASEVFKQLFLQGTQGQGSLYQVTAPASGSAKVVLTAGDNAEGDLNFQILDATTLAVVASGQAVVPDSTDAETEPNDSITMAGSTRLTGPGSVTIDGTIGDGEFGATSGDFDFFRIDADAQQKITATVASRPESQLNPAMILYAEDGEVLNVVETAGIGGSETLSFTAETTRSFFLAILDAEDPTTDLPGDPFTAGTGRAPGNTGSYALAIKVETTGPGAVKQATVNVEKGDTLLLLVENGTGDFELDFANLDQFRTPGTNILRFPAGPGPSRVVVADFNADQRQDLAVSSASTQTLSVLLGNGDGTLQAPSQFETGAFSALAAGFSELEGLVFGRDLSVADFNNDGLPDLATVNTLSSDVSILLGRGDGSFESHRRFNATAAPVSIAIGDLNGDSIVDFVASDRGRVRTLATSLGRGDGTFEPADNLLIEEGDGSDVRIADFNNDGTGDLVIKTRGVEGLRVLLGNGDGTFVPGSQTKSVDLHTGFAIADLNDDGNLDFMIGGPNLNVVNVHLGDGDGGFTDLLNPDTLKQGFEAGQFPTAFAVADARLALD